jgi:hypothetical protein
MFLGFRLRTPFDMNRRVLDVLGLDYFWYFNFRTFMRRREFSLDYDIGDGVGRIISMQEGGLRGGGLKSGGSELNLF